MRDSSLECHFLCCACRDEEGEDGLTDEKPLPVDVIRRRCKDKVVVGAAAAFTNTSRASNVKPKVPRRISRTAN
jgi:hypothetical protein